MIARIAKFTAVCVAFFLVAGISAYVTLTLIVKSEDTVIVPDLVGKDVVSALERLTDLELNTKVKGSEYSPEFPKNHVVLQEPEPGSEIKKGRDVRIIISKGPKNILMPNLVGLSVQQARMIMEENGLSQGNLSSIYNNTNDKDYIIAQLPSSGSMISRGSSVNILVSLGHRPRAYMMPDLEDLSLDEAVIRIENAHLSVGEIYSLFQKNKVPDVVVRQEPLAGYKVIDGLPVRIAINRSDDKRGAERLHHPLFGSLLQHRISNGFLKKRIRVEVETKDTINDIFDDYIKPGEDVWILVPRDRDATVFIFEDDKLVKTRIFEAW
jgi:serine/threonine-protein kinase